MSTIFVVYLLLPSNNIYFYQGIIKEEFRRIEFQVWFA